MAASECTPSLAMVTVQMGFAGVVVVSKLAMDSGVSPYVMIAYRQLIGAIVLAPFAFFLERKSRMKISSKILFQIFLCSLFGGTGNQLLYFIGLKHSTPTIACALSNILPAVTFIMAIPFRMETVGINTLAGQAKILGTALSVGGSMLMTFYQGPPVKMWPSHIHWKYVEATTARATTGSGQNTILGDALLILSSVVWAIWFIIQARMSKSFSSPYTSSAIMCFMAGLQCTVIGAGVERSLSSWEVGWDIRLVACVYSGVIGSGLAVSLISWCIDRKGPLFVSMFSPLLLVIVAILGWAILDEKLYTGSVTGSLLVVGGLYMVLWGKGREVKKMVGVNMKSIDAEQEMEESNSSVSSPLSYTPSHELHHVQPKQETEV